MKLLFVIAFLLVLDSKGSLIKAENYNDYIDAWDSAPTTQPGESSVEVSNNKKFQAPNENVPIDGRHLSFQPGDISKIPLGQPMDNVNGFFLGKLRRKIGLIQNHAHDHIHALAQDHFHSHDHYHAHDANPSDSRDSHAPAVNGHSDESAAIGRPLANYREFRGPRDHGLRMALFSRR